MTSEMESRSKVEEKVNQTAIYKSAPMHTLDTTVARRDILVIFSVRGIAMTGIPLRKMEVETTLLLVVLFCRHFQLAQCGAGVASVTVRGRCSNVLFQNQTT